MALAQADAGSAAARPLRDDGRPGRRGARGAGRRGPQRRRRSSPTPRSTPRRSTGRSVRRSSPRCRATGAPTSSTRRTGARASARSSSTSSEGADVVMVKPAIELPRRARRRRGDRAPCRSGRTRCPASTRWSRRPRANGWIDRDRTDPRDDHCGIRRAGADAVLTYWAIELAGMAALTELDATTTMTTATTALFERAQQVDPGRGQLARSAPTGSVGGTPRFLRLGARAVRDRRGRAASTSTWSRSWGPAILGHAHPAVVEAVQEAAARGLSFGASTPGETELAELVRERVARGRAARRSRRSGWSRRAPRRR